MITLNLNPELEKRIQEEANFKGLSIEQYLQNLIEEKLNIEPNNLPLKGSILHDEDPFEPAISSDDWDVLLSQKISLPKPDPTLTPEEKIAKWEQVIAKLPQNSANLPDEALHRETMYEDEY